MRDQVKAIAEEGYAVAIQRGEGSSKSYFLKILMIIEGEEASLSTANGRREGCGSFVGVPSRGGSKQRARIADKRDVYIVAYTLSKYEHHGLFERRLSQTEALRIIAGRLGMKDATLRNYRDTFDRYTGSHRRGWDGPLNPLQQEVFDELQAKGQSEVEELARGVLTRFE